MDSRSPWSGLQPAPAQQPPAAAQQPPAPSGLQEPAQQPPAPSGPPAATGAVPNLERRVAAATPVSLVDGMELFVDTSGHVVNRQGVPGEFHGGRGE